MFTSFSSLLRKPPEAVIFGYTASMATLGVGLRRGINIQGKLTQKNIANTSGKLGKVDKRN